MTARHVVLRTGGLAMVVAALAQGSPSAQIAVSANDAKVALVNGVNTTVRNPPPDTATILDLGVMPLKVIATVRAPASVIGPPQSVAITPDASLALVTASTKIDPADPTKTVPDDRVSVIDLKATPPTVIETLHAGAGAAGISINRTGTLALVANRSEGTVSIFTIAGKTVKGAGKVDLGAPASIPSLVVFTPDGRRALVTRNGDSFISLLSVDGAKVTYAKQDVTAGFQPYGINVTPDGHFALVASIGAGLTGGTDTIGVIDLTMAPPRTVNQVPVGPIPEGLAISPDGRFAAVTVMNGTNAAPTSPFFHDFGLLRIFGFANGALAPITEARIGHWCQGAAWSRDSRSVVVGCMVEKRVLAFRFDGHALASAGSVAVAGGPAGIRAAGQ